MVISGSVSTPCLLCESGVGWRVRMCAIGGSVRAWTGYSWRDRGSWALISWSLSLILSSIYGCWDFILWTSDQEACALFDSRTHFETSEALLQWNTDQMDHSFSTKMFSFQSWRYIVRRDLSAKNRSKKQGSRRLWHSLCGVGTSYI
jgi:hypothetical protein